MHFSTMFWVEELIFLYPSVCFHFWTRSSISSSILALFYELSLLRIELVSELPRSSSSWSDASSCFLKSSIDSYYIKVFGIGISISVFFGNFFLNLRPPVIDLIDTLLCILGPGSFILGVLRDPLASFGEDGITIPDLLYLKLGY